MRRRNFILASGSTVLSGLVASGIQRSAIGLDFEISTPNKDPSKVDSLVIEFETLEITPRYLDEKEPVSVQAKVEVANQTKRSNELQTSVINGRTKNLENSIDSVVVDGLNTSSGISGDVTVSIDHPDIQDSYSQQFYVNSSEIPDSGVYLHDDWEDNKLTNRDDSGTATYNGVEGVYRPEWTTDNGSPQAINGTIEVTEGDSVYTPINIDLSQDVTWKWTNVDLQHFRDLNMNLSLQAFAEGNSRLDIGDGGHLKSGYAIHADIVRANKIELFRIDSDGSITKIISTSGVDAIVDIELTRTSGGTWELFIDSSSQGTGSDSTFTNPQYTSIAFRDRDGDAYATVDEMKIN